MNGKTDHIQTLTDTIHWLATERQKDPVTKCANLASAMHSIRMEIGLALVPYYKEGRNE